MLAIIPTTINILIFTFRDKDLIIQNYFYSERLPFFHFLEMLKTSSRQGVAGDVH